jgi:hypothetical protein
MFDISAADILKGVFLPLITLFITIVKTPFRIRQENHGKLRALLESVESNKGERIQLLLFRDYMRSKNASLLELQQLLALPDAILGTGTLSLYPLSTTDTAGDAQWFHVERAGR